MLVEGKTDPETTRVRRSRIILQKRGGFKQALDTEVLVTEGQGKVAVLFSRCLHEE